MTVPAHDRPITVRLWRSWVRHFFLGESPLDRLLAAAPTSGRPFLLDLGFVRTWVLVRPEHAQHVLVDNADNYRKGGRLPTPLRKLVGRGAAVQDAQRWRHLRAAMLPHLHGERLNRLPEVVHTTWQTLASPLLEEATAGCLTDVTTLLDVVSVGIACQMVGCGAPSLAQVMAYRQAVHALTHEQGLFWLLGQMLPWAPGFGRSRFTRQAAQMTARWLASREQRGCGTGDLVASLFQALVNEQADVHARTGDLSSMDPALRAQLEVEVFHLLVAAHETVSAGLAWTLALLLDHPAILRQVTAECAQARNLTAPMPLLDAAIQESLRLYPPAWRITRRAVDADEIDGCEIPKGASVLVFVYGLHRQADLWPDPHEFRPERFLEASRSGLRWTWLPFGVGRRSCVGAEMALKEMRLVLAWLLRHFHLDAPGPVLPAKVHVAVALRPREPLLVHLRPRQG